MSIREKTLATDFDAWNHPLRAKVLLVVFAIVGFSVGYFMVPHFVATRFMEGIGTAIFGGLVVFLGAILLALLD